MKVSRHCRLTSMIATVVLASSAGLPSGWADGNETGSTPREVAMAASSKGLESSNRPLEPTFAVIEQVQTAALGQRVQVRVVASGALSCAPFRLADPDRLVLDCTGAHVRVRLRPNRVDLNPVRSVRVGQFKPDVARVVVDLEGQPMYSLRPDGNTLVVTFDSNHPKSSTFEPTIKTKESAPSPVNRQMEQEPSTIVSKVPDNPEEAKHAEVDSSSPTSATPPSAIKQDLSSDAPGSLASVSNDPPTLPATDVEPNSPVETFDAAVADDDYVIGAQDVLAINVWHEPEVSRSVPVRPDGKISLPLIGDISVSGLTPRLLQNRLTKEFDSYIRKPQVTVIVQEVNSRKFYVIGQVEKPGTYPLATHVAILDALAMAGGFRDFAKVQQIYLLRLVPDGSRKRIFFDYKAAVNGKDTYRDIEIQTGDTLVVP
jgi:polysaccharide export outer membrane protein